MLTSGLREPSLLMASLGLHLLLIWAVLPWKVQSFGAHLRRPWETTVGGISSHHAQGGGHHGAESDEIFIVFDLNDELTVARGSVLSTASPCIPANILWRSQRTPPRQSYRYGDVSTALHMSPSADNNVGGPEDESSFNATARRVTHHQSPASTRFAASSSLEGGPGEEESSDAARSSPPPPRQFDSVSWSVKRPQAPSYPPPEPHHRGQKLTRVNGADYVPAPTVRNSLGPLWKMTRPENFPGIVLFHLLGTFLAVRHVAETATYKRIIVHPGLFMTLFSLLLTSSASMVVNDYYDAKLGRDAYKLHTSASTGQPLLKGDVPLPVARRFLSYLYGASLLVLTVVPGIPTRLSVVTGLMITYFYTQSLKPISWVKNFVCASLIALAPLTSGTAAVHLLVPSPQAFGQSLSIVSLWRLVSVLFFGVFAREVIMDCNDKDADRRAGIMTVPVVHGRRYAARVALLSNVAMALSAIGGPVGQLVLGRAASSLPSLRRLALASMGSALAIRRVFQVLQTQGADKAINDRAVEEGLLTVLFFLASFI